MSRAERDIGPVGTASRVVGGLLFVALPVAVWGLGWWDVAASVAGFPLLALAAGVLLPRARPVLWAWGVFAAVLGAATLVTFVTPVDATAIWVFLGVSTLLGAARGYGGCEVLAIPNVIMGRRDRVGCLIYSPIDALEARYAGPG